MVPAMVHASCHAPHTARLLQDASAQRKQRKKDKKKKKAGKGGRSAANGGDEAAEDAASQSPDEDGGAADSASPEPGSPTSGQAAAKQAPMAEHHQGPEPHPDSSESDQAAEPASDHRHRPPAEPMPPAQTSPSQRMRGMPPAPDGPCHNMRAAKRRDRSRPMPLRPMACHARQTLMLSWCMARANAWHTTSATCRPRPI